MDQQGQISFTIPAGEVAPLSLGDFPSERIPKPKEYFKVSSLLEIQLDDRDYFFELSRDNLQIQIDSDCYEVVSLMYGADISLAVFERLDTCKSNLSIATVPPASTSINATFQPTSTNLTAISELPVTVAEQRPLEIVIPVIGTVISAILGVIGVTITAYATIQSAKINKIGNEKKKRK